ncbi:MAG TPA: DUF1573 domain-containing protein [Chitinophagaceae bacterium]|jgi:hypothetical protein|nr:DUF1573 domain-containing protein [Chitinophagaceae bacterium]
MKKILLYVLSFVAIASVNAQTESSAPVDVLLVKQTEFDFGKIPQGKPVYTTFEIVNQGSTPLKLDNVSASCGCTTPEWSRDEIAPGATAVIKVGYNAAAEGAFEKPITITYNGSQTKVLKIKGQVWKAPAGAAPSNSSVSFLKSQLNS